MPSSRITRGFKSNEKGASDRTASAYSDDNGKVWRWCSNNQVIPPDVTKTYDIPCDDIAQRAAYDKETSDFLARYRAANSSGPSSEERSEARAAFGPGVELVNVFTGRRWTT